MENQDRKDLREVLDRARRTETRVTKIGRSMGIDVGGGTPSYDEEQRQVTIPSLNCSIGEIMNCVPQGKIDGVTLVIGEQYLMTLRKPG